MEMKTIKVAIYFPTNIIARPITYHLVKDYDLLVNILNADVSLDKVGKLVMDITGKEENIDKGLNFINEQGADYKLIAKTVVWQEEACVHCGACTAVCPSGALHMDKDDWQLNFDKEKCLACELCINACPLRVMCISI
jgi:Pyruvate/2-oxoacid:ferredoxin oxidoreductase delta subunit